VFSGVGDIYLFFSMSRTLTTQLAIRSNEYFSVIIIINIIVSIGTQATQTAVAK
jgi:hypothetical protein